MNSAHKLLQANTIEGVKQLLGTSSLEQYLGDMWVETHSNTHQIINKISRYINENKI